MYIATLTKDMTPAQLYAEIVKGTQENNFPGIVGTSVKTCCFRSNMPDLEGNFNAQTKCCLAGMFVTNKYLNTIKGSPSAFYDIPLYIPSLVDGFIYENGPIFLTKPLGLYTLLGRLRLTHNEYALQHTNEWSYREKADFLAMIQDVFKQYELLIAT